MTIHARGLRARLEVDGVVKLWGAVIALAVQDAGKKIPGDAPVQKPGEPEYRYWARMTSRKSLQADRLRLRRSARDFITGPDLTAVCAYMGADDAAIRRSIRATSPWMNEQEEGAS